jgi:hypothetical protein
MFAIYLSIKYLFQITYPLLIFGRHVFYRPTVAASVGRICKIFKHKACHNFCRLYPVCAFVSVDPLDPPLIQLPDNMGPDFA